MLTKSQYKECYFPDRHPDHPDGPEVLTEEEEEAKETEIHTKWLAHLAEES